MKHLDDAESMAVMDGEPGAEHLRLCLLEQALGEFTVLHRGRKLSAWKYAAVAAMIVVGVGIWWTQQRGDLPNTSFTPGATRPMTQQQVCAALARDDGRTAPRKMAAVVFASYGLKDSKPRAFEVEGR